MRRLTGFLGVFAFVLTACGDSDSPGGGGTSTGSTETGSSTGETGDDGADDGGDTTGPDGGGDTTSSDGGDTSGTGTTDTTGTTTDSTTSVLACTGTCVDEAPQGWVGPFAIAIATGDSAPQCEGDYPTESFVAYDALNVPEGTCTCTCDAPEGSTCPTEVDVAYGNAANSCADVVVTSIDASCNAITPVPVDTNNRYWSVVSPTPSGGTCMPTLTPDLPTPSWDTSYAGCEGELAEGTCQDAEDLCVTPPSEPLAEVLCIWEYGDVDCPEGDYGVKTLLHGDFDDTRDCEPCACSAPEGTCTEPVVRMNAQDSCACMTSACDFGTTCTETPFDASIYGLELRTVPTVEEVECAPSDPQVTGEASPTEPRTVCCTE